MSYRQSLIDRIEVPVKLRQAMAGTIRTEYLSAGHGSPVILLHGAGAGAVIWYPTIGAIAEHFHVIAPDIVGYGESDKPDARYDRPYFSAWLRDFFLALGISRASVVGLSQGGAISLQFALDNPQMVEKLVLVDSGALGAKPPLFPFIGMLWLNCFPSTLANRFFSRYLLFDPKNRDPNHGHYSVEVIKRGGGKNAFRNGRGSAVSGIPANSLRQIACTTLIIWGADDKLFSIETGQAAASLIPNATFCRIPRAGHLPLMDQPDAFNAALLQFLGGSERFFEGKS